MINIKDFGATGDGRNDTAAIQAAADRCRENGGGHIFIPSGEYIVTSVRLYSNTTLELAPDARLLLDSDEENFENKRGIYDDDFKRDVKSLFSRIHTDKLTYHLKLQLEVFRHRTDTMFFAEGEENISIKGGTLDGRYHLFYETDKSHPEGEEAYRLVFNLFRPHMLVFRNCKNLVLEDMQIVNAPFFNIRILECDTARCENLTILANKRCINTDGINVGASRHCIIKGCHITTGDDCIAISVGENIMQHCDCEDITVCDCVGDTNTCFVRVFSGIDVDLGYWRGVSGDEELNFARTQKVKNVFVSDCVVNNGGCTVNIISTYGAVENISFKNIKSLQTGGHPAVFIAIQKEGTIKNIKIDELDCKAQGVATIIGTNKYSVSGIELCNCKFFIEPKTKLFGNGIIDPLIHYWIASQAPYNFYVRHAHNISVKNCEVRWGKADFNDILKFADIENVPAEYRHLWREDMTPQDSFPCLCAYDTDGLYLENFEGEGYNGANKLRLEKVENYRC